jgi:type VI secretion system protein ImpG
MSSEMLPYYERELTLLRSLAAEFAEQHPKVAARLELGRDGSRDPHVERLLQGTAFLAADIHKRLDDDFPELTNTLLDMLCPHYLRPVPSMAIVEFGIDQKQAALTSGYKVPRGTELESERVDDEQCVYRTCFDLQLWPLRISAASLVRAPFQLPVVPPPGTAAVLGMTLETLSPGVEIAKMPLRDLRFHLHADAGQSVFALYELLLTKCIGIVVSAGPDDDAAVVLSPEHLKAAGFADEDAALPEESRGFSGYRLLTEFFALPRKYLFVELCDLPQQVIGRLGPKLELSFLLSTTTPDLEQIVSPKTFRLGCTPIVNLFRQTFDPLTIDGTKSEYCITPDVRRPRAVEIYSLESVHVSHPGQAETEARPFFQLMPGFQLSGGLVDPSIRWMAQRRMHREPRPDGLVDAASDLWLTLIDETAGQLGLAGLTVHTSGLCTNRNQPSRLPFAVGRPRLAIRSGMGPVGTVECLCRPTSTVRVRPGRDASWKLLSHLSLNYLSLAGDTPGVAARAVREMLSLYLLDDLDEYEQKRRWIDGIREVAGQRVAARVGSRAGSVCQGVEVRVELDDEHFNDHADFLFSSILERFFAAWVNINSFTRFVSTSRQRESRKEQWRWPPRAGSKALL